jgi:hypothetical protein
LPAESEIAREFECGRDTVRMTLIILRNEGLVSTSRDKPASSRARSERRALVLRPDEQLVARMPRHQERKHLALDPGVPVLEVHRADGGSDLLPADQVTVVCATTTHSECRGTQQQRAASMPSTAVSGAAC